MKFGLYVVTALIVVSCTQQQGNFEEKIQKHERKMLDMAFVTGDVQMAIQSTQAMLLYDSANINLMDTLVNLYLALSDYGSAYFTSGRILEIDSVNEKALEARAKSAALLNKNSDALMLYKKLFGLKADTRYLYEMAVLNYNSGLPEQGEELLKKLIDMPQSRTDLYTYRLKGGQLVQVPVLAVVYFFIGTYIETKGLQEEAIEYYRKSLEVYPGYGLAANKLNELTAEK